MVYYQQQFTTFPFMKLNLFLFGVLVFFGITSCSRADQTSTIQLSETFTLEGPLFEGSNPAQIVYPVNLSSLLGDKYHEGISIAEAKLSSAKISALDSANLNGISSMVLSLAADNPELKMLELGVINPVKAGSAEVMLNPSLEADAGKYFLEKQFYIVLDVALPADREENMALKGEIEFTIKHN